jgi:hypothetical protein
MSIFATIDSNGRATGFFLSYINPIIPDGAIEISSELHRAWLADTVTQRLVNGVLEPCDQPPPPPVTDVSFWQFMMAAWKLEFITHEEALAAVRSRIMPPAFAAAIADLPTEAKLEAELKFAGITRMLRSDPLFSLVVAANVATDEQIDGVFAVAATIA